MIVGQNREALDEKETFPDGNCDRITCCRILKSEALKHTLSRRVAARSGMDHTSAGYVETTRTTSRTPA